MSSTPRVLCLSGSARRSSLNKKLARLGTEIAGRHGADARFVDLGDYPLPIYDGDLEAAEGLPEAARTLKQQLIDSDAMLIASPEYNSSIPPLLKNALDWASRKESADEAPLRAYRGKVAALAGASPGGFGGHRAQVPLRMMLANIGVHVLPDTFTLPQAHEAFDDDGQLQEPQRRERLESVVASLIHTAARLSA